MFLGDLCVKTVKCDGKRFNTEIAEKGAENTETHPPRRFVLRGAG